MAMVLDSHNDFALFPRDPQFLDIQHDDNFESLQNYNALDMNQHSSDLASTYDSFPSALAFSSNYYGSGGEFDYGGEVHKEAERSNQQQFTPSGSPSPSVSQSFDHPPSILSSTSGASAQSTASSAVGSPFPHEMNHNTPGQELWFESHQGLGIAAGVSRDEDFGGDLLTYSDLNGELVYDENKYPLDSFVGESIKIFSSSISTTTTASVLASVSSCTSSPILAPAPFFSPLALDASVATRINTIDTILEEVNSRMDSPMTALASPEPVSSIEASPRSFRSTRPIIQPAHSSRHGRNSFKSPTTPASAMSPFTPRFTPPAIGRRRESRSNSIGSRSDSRAQQSPALSSHRAHPYARPPQPPSPHSQTHFHQSQSPFFGQSSGRFIAPLESSCWFSSIACTLVFFPLLFSQISLDLFSLLFSLLF